MAEQVQLDAQVVAELREQARKSLFFFAKAILRYRDLSPTVHKPLCELLQDSTKNRKRVILPRGWFKTSVATIAYPIWLSIQETTEKTGANERILVVQNTHNNARSKLQSIRQHWERNGLLRALFPELLPNKECTWAADVLQLSRPGMYPEGTYECAGIRTQVVSRHYTRIIEDDTVAPDLDELGVDNLAPTKDDIDQAIGFHKLLMPLLVHPADEILVIGTRWFEVDLLSWIGENEKNYFSYVRACKENDEGQPDEAGHLTFPERFTQDVLDALRVAMGPYMYSCLYMNLPIRSEDMIFQLDWFQYYATEPVDLIVTTTVDPANEEALNKGETDWNVVCTTGKSLTTGNIYVLEVTRLKGSPGEVLNVIFDHQLRWKSIKVGIESVQYQKSLIYWTKELMRKRNQYFAVEAIMCNSRSKIQRIVGLQPVHAAKKIFYRPQQAFLVNELLLFPYGKHDDAADALSMHLPLWAMTRSKDEEVEVKTGAPVQTFDDAEEELVRKYEEEHKGSLILQTLADTDEHLWN